MSFLKVIITADSSLPSWMEEHNSTSIPVYTYGCFQKQWYPQIIHVNRVFHCKPSILGVPPFTETPISKSLKILSVRSIKLFLMFQLKQLVHFHNLFIPEIYPFRKRFQTLSVSKKIMQKLEELASDPSPTRATCISTPPTQGISCSSTSNWGRTPTSSWMTELRVRPVSAKTLRFRLLHELGLTKTWR